MDNHISKGLLGAEMLKKFFYGLGNLSYSVIGQTVSNFFMFFATSVLGLSGTLVGIAVSISTIWDGASDTIFGYISDKHPIGKFGNRNGYMLIATIGMATINIALWCVPNSFSVALKFVWILLSLLLLETFNTMFATPYMALGNELASSYDDRTKINATSTIFYLIGIIIPSILLVIFLPNTEQYPVGQLNPNGYKSIAFVTSILCTVCGLISSILTIPKMDKTTPRTNENTTEKMSLKLLFDNFLKAFKDKNLCRIIIGYVLTSVATVFLCSVGLHFFTYSFFYTSKQITFLLLTLMFGTIISQPLWVFVSHKKRKTGALVAGIITTALSVFGVMFVYLFRIEIYEISYILMLIAIFICGLGSGALYSLPASIYGDLVEDLCKDKENLTATYSGTLTFASNIGNSIAQLIVGVLLDLIHFDSSETVQTLGVQTGLALILFIGVQVSLILSCFIFAGHKEKSNLN